MVLASLSTTAGSKPAAAAACFFGIGEMGERGKLAKTLRISFLCASV